MLSVVRKLESTRLLGYDISTMSISKPFLSTKLVLKLVR